MEKLYVQMYSFGSFSPEDNEANFAMAKELGFDGVELFGPNFTLEAEDLAKVLEENGLQAISLHADADSIEEFIPYAKVLGLQFMGIGMHYIPDAKAAQAFAKRLNQIGEVCTNHGIMLTYHNHTQEFLEVDGTTILELLIENTDARCVGFELDAGWCAAAGTDPIAFVEKHSGRIKLIHLKESSEVIGVQPPMNLADIDRDENGYPQFSQEQIDKMEYSKSINCPAGEGIVDWKRLKQVASANGCVAYIVERENTYAGTRMDCLKADVAYYRGI
jgi:sugar phosphate isomerase/epimerase